MSQRSQLDGSQTGLLAGRGLLAAAETLNFSMNDHQGGIMPSRLGMGGSMGGPGGGQANQRGSGGHLGSTVKLVASLGLSPSDLDALALIPEENISIETLPQILMKLKSQKADSGKWQGPSCMSSGGGRSSSLGQSSASSDFGRGSMQDSSSRSLNFSGGRDRGYNNVPRHDSYSSMDMAPPDSGFQQRRMGSPSYGKVQDFLGTLPNMFPHVCSLCDFDVFSLMEWNQHVQGQRHAENRRMLLNMYPDWDPFMSSGRRRVESSNMSPGLLGPPPMSSGTMSGGMMSSWGPSGARPGQSLRSKVVVVKYDRKPQNTQMLLSLTKRFGRLRKQLILKNKAFLEMDSHEAAKDMVEYYQQNQSSLFGKPLNIYLSERMMVIESPGQGSQVVFFSKLPREDAKKRELLTIAERFGTVEKHLFLTDQAFVQMGSPEDAEMLVKYYTVNPLTIRGHPVHLNICTKYKTLNVNRRQNSQFEDGRGQRSEGSWTGPRTQSKAMSKTKKEVKPAGQDKEAQRDQQATRMDDQRTDNQEQEVAMETPADGGRAEEAGVDESTEQKEETEESRVQPHADAENYDNNKGDLSGPEDLDVPENMEDFVTLDEVALEEDDGQDSEFNDIEPGRKGGMRVVSVVGFRRGHNFLGEILALAKPFGEVKRNLVLDLKPQAYVQFETEQEALAMAKFYSTNVTATVCGRMVRIAHSLAYPTIRCGSSKVVYVGQIPTSKYSDSSLLKMADPYGKVRKYFLNRNKRECFIEMDTADEAEKMAEACKADPPRFNGKRLTVYVSRKYRQLKYGHVFRTTEKREHGSSPTPDDSQEPATKRVRPQQEAQDDEEREVEEEEKKDETQEEEEDEENKESNTEDQDAKMEESSEPLDQNGDPEAMVPVTVKQEVTYESDGNDETQAGTLPPFDPETPLGEDQVESGFYCHACSLFFTDEETAKKLHCSSRTHYDNLRKQQKSSEESSE